MQLFQDQSLDQGMYDVINYAKLSNLNEKMMSNP